MFSEMVQDNFLLIADSTKRGIFQIDLSAGSVWKIPLVRQKRPIAVAFDPLDSKIYWTDVREKLIQSSNLDGTSLKVVRSLHRSKYQADIPVYRLYWKTQIFLYVV